eukprot:CAMPEP_0168771314 /NCGR_PEP_ID=MMETSP0725-20121227/3375_1 /TAXON_ID=265536 /ORGANISM="Amphiprora sp., Strain CCMP467" /LENGTH=653 /DNA_ID=CAMNT_0008820793 /DNA_START=22 /DNA_END=1984 /DNA_ORIENTATION=-
MTATSQKGGNTSANVPQPSTLNVYKKISIIRRPEDSLTYEDAGGNVKTVSAVELGEALHATQPNTNDSDTAANKQQQQQQAKKQKQDIPVPLIRAVGGYECDISATFQQPLSYVRYHRATPQELKDQLEYVLDAEDEAWLASKNSKLEESTKTTTKTTATATTTTPAQPQPQRLTFDLLELMMDILEKETGFESIITTHTAYEVFAQKIPQLFSIFPAKQAKHSNSTTTTTAKQIISDVYNYWMHKRSKLKRPLFRRFWPVTSTDDTNPHLVFRPREKEKYKLRKKRQNDMDSYHKLQRLRRDFDTVRAVLALIRRREQVARVQLQLHMERHRQDLFELLDTSGSPARQVVARGDGTTTPAASLTTANASTLSSTTKMGLNKTTLQQILSIPHVFDVHGGGSSLIRGNKGGRQPHSRSHSTMVSGTNLATTTGGGSMMMDLSASSAFGGPKTATTTAGGTATESSNLGVPGAAGQKNGEPAPNFLQPLPTRQAYVTSWEGAVPHVTSYQANGQAKPTLSSDTDLALVEVVAFASIGCRARINKPATTFFTASRGLANANPQHAQSARLLDLLPRPLDTQEASRRIEELCVASIYEDHHQAMAAANAVAANPEAATNDEAFLVNDGDEVVVRTEAWLDTDDHLWGEERHSLEPL